MSSLKIDRHHRQAELRYRFDPHHARDPVHHVLDRKGYELLDFLRRQPFGFGVDLDLHRRDIGEGVDVQSWQSARMPPATMSIETTATSNRSR